MLQKIRSKSEGFTLIELMIVIAIIGILAAIAIPNFVAYRNKAFCTGAEKDAQTIAAGIAEYFSIAANRSLTCLGGAACATLTTAVAGVHGIYVPTNLSGLNTWSVGPATNNNFEILVTDSSSRCPTDYKASANSAANPTGYWDAATPAGQYVKRLGN